jgi:hypothetical protein
MTARKVDLNGYISIENNPISRVGVFPYLGKSIPGADDPAKVYKVYRPAEELENPETIASFRHLPIIDDHTMLGAAADGFTPAEHKGVHGVTGDNVDFRNNVLYSNLKIFSETLKRRFAEGKKDLSLGYRCRYEKSPGTFDGQAYDFVQRSLRGNHLALVDAARCDVAVLDNHITMDSFDLPINEKDLQMPTPEEIEAAKTTPGATPGAATAEPLTIDDLAAKLDALAAVVEKVVKALPGAEPVADPAAEKKVPPVAKAADAEPEPKKDETEKKVDAMDSRISAMDSKIVSEKDIIKSIAVRDRLAGKISDVVGTFDHSEMTLGEVAVYGVDKLKLTAPKGQETVALDSYFAARDTLKTGTVVAMDAAPKSSEVDAFINKKKA